MLFRLSLVILASLALNACGWQLRGTDKHVTSSRPTYQDISVDTGRGMRDFETTMIRQLKDLSIDITSRSQNKLFIARENLERKPLAYSNTGIPIQYQLIVSVDFAFSSAGQENNTLARTLIARRSYDFDTALIIAKREEELQLLQEMRRELAQRIIASTVSKEQAR